MFTVDNLRRNHTILMANNTILETNNLIANISQVLHGRLWFYKMYIPHSIILCVQQMSWF